MNVCIRWVGDHCCFSFCTVACIIGIENWSSYEGFHNKWKTNWIGDMGWENKFQRSPRGWTIIRYFIMVDMGIVVILYSDINLMN